MTKLKVARKVFETLTLQGRPITKATLARLGDFSRSLLSPYPDGTYKSKEWEALAKDIASYQKMGNSIKTHSYRNKMNDLQNYNKLLERKYHAQVEQTSGLFAEMVELRRDAEAFKTAFERTVEEKDKLEDQCRLSAVHIREEQHSRDNVFYLGAAVIISPDDELIKITGGKDLCDGLTMRQAHTCARKKLNDVLVRGVPKRLYIPIGRPGAGKSSWIRSHMPSGDRRLAIYYDATNSTVADRQELQEIARQSKNTIVAYVYFDIDVATCIRNNRERKDKLIPEHVVRNFAIDPPELNEGFDELIVVRSNLGDVID